MSLDASVLDYLAIEGAKWIRSVRNELRDQALDLPPELRSRLSGHFSNETLDVVRISALPTIPNPPFYADLAKRGIDPPIDFTVMDGLTFCDTVVFAASHPMSPQGLDALFFHECVHVAQYRLLGVEKFLDEYVRGWAAKGMQYAAIPLEAEAYELQAAYTAGRIFPVEKVLAEARRPRSA